MNMIKYIHSNLALDLNAQSLDYIFTNSVFHNLHRVNRQLYRQIFLSVTHSCL